MAISTDLSQTVFELRIAQRAAWARGDRLLVESYLQQHPELAGHEEAALDFIYSEYCLREEVEEVPDPNEYVRRFPQWARPIQRVLDLHRAMNHTDVMLAPIPFHATDRDVDTILADPPHYIGRYRVERILGKGGFCLVYLAHDDYLQRRVAIKVLHAPMVAQATRAEGYLTEARTVANLDHPHIVPVFDVGSTDEFPCFIVSKYIDGTDLAAKLMQARLTIYEIVELVAKVAEALQYAHERGLVHRDIKPENILLDKHGNCFVADFGLALREQDVGKGPRFAGTPVYMSPEQARGEGHRVDGRSDIFSLGAVFYELLTGQRAFTANSPQELMAKINKVELCPPRQVDERVPKELERICLKAMSKRTSDRYSTARELAEELESFLTESLAVSMSTAMGQARDQAEIATPNFLTSTTPVSCCLPNKVVPKGLRSFDSQDAEFFLELLPGPRDRDGLPDSIRFWKKQLEEIDADNTFSIGLLYGPSGCGKSSLVKAGLVPHLSEAVIPIYVEAAPEETEIRLLHALRKRFATMPDKMSLKEIIAAFRCGQGVPLGKKVVIILDQFEQWLHAMKHNQDTELVQALRHCDGGRVQCVVMVRDDFWMAATRFMRELEVSLVEAHNSAAIDLFDVDHAKKVLAAFGQAFDRLPENLADLRDEQTAFLRQAVAGLAQDGKVISVRLGLFAEMMKGRPWTPASLKEVGGIEGIGLTFLEETFSLGTAPPLHRYHQQAARAVLKALLPDSGTDLKGLMRSYDELLDASGYQHRPDDFDELIRLLDSEIRLITPTELSGNDDDPATIDDPKHRAYNVIDMESSSCIDEKLTCRYYQLTHDYLVPALRDWLTRKQKETRRGRAELMLADRAAIWNARPESRFLPSLVQWLQLRFWTEKQVWTQAQQRMMRSARSFHALRAVLAASIVALVAWGSYETKGTYQAHALLDHLLDATPTKVPEIIGNMSAYRRWINPLLQDALQNAQADNEPRRQLHASIALLPVDRRQVEFLYQRLLDTELRRVPLIRDALEPHKSVLLDRLWSVVESTDSANQSKRIRASAALAKYDQKNSRWTTVSAAVADDLVNVPTVHLYLWLSTLRPVRSELLAPLSDIFQDLGRKESERSMATDILADYAADQPRVLAELLMDADQRQFDVIFPCFERLGDGLSALIDELDRQLDPEAPDEAKEKLGRRQANAAVALLRMNRPEIVWPVFRHSPDPRVRSYLIHRLGPLGVDARVIMKRFETEPDITIQRALLLSLGEYDDERLPPETRDEWLPKLQTIYLTTHDSGLHASAEWLLRQWKHAAWLARINEEWANDQAQQAKRLEETERTLANASQPAPARWYVNGQNQTLSVIPGPVEFIMGTPPSEEERRVDEVQYRKRIGRTFALSNKLVTLEQFQRFDETFSFRENQYNPDLDCPVVGTTWFHATAYCNWLSRQENIPEHEWCYEIDGDNVRMPDNYLSLTGYRLPTEAEMEYAYRAGALTVRYYGSTHDLLSKYAWYQNNSQTRSQPGGCLKPNDLGLFDMAGNVSAWCQDRYRKYPTGMGTEADEDREQDLIIDSSHNRVLRGGAFTEPSWRVRSGHRYARLPSYRSSVHGIRLARTLRQGSAEEAP